MIIRDQKPTFNHELEDKPPLVLSRNRRLLEIGAVLVTALFLGRIPEPWRSYALVACMLYVPLMAKSKRPRWLAHGDENQFWLLFSALILILFVLIFPAILIFLKDRSWHNIDPMVLGQYLLYTTVAAALPEEWFFRSFLMTRWRSSGPHKYRLVPSRDNLLVALVFGLVHVAVDLNPMRMLVAVPSLWYGAILERKGGLALAVATHALSNVLMYAVLKGFGY